MASPSIPEQPSFIRRYNYGQAPASEPVMLQQPMPSKPSAQAAALGKPASNPTAALSTLPAGPMQDPVPKTSWQNIGPGMQSSLPQRMPVIQNARPAPLAAAATTAAAPASPAPTPRPAALPAAIAPVASPDMQKSAAALAATLEKREAARSAAPGIQRGKDANGNSVYDNTGNLAGTVALANSGFGRDRSPASGGNVPSPVPAASTGGQPQVWSASHGSQAPGHYGPATQAPIRTATPATAGVGPMAQASVLVPVPAHTGRYSPQRDPSQRRGPDPSAPRAYRRPWQRPRSGTERPAPYGRR